MWARKLLRLTVAMVCLTTAVVIPRPESAHALSAVVGYLDSADMVGFGVLHVRGWAVTADCKTCAIGIYIRAGGARLHEEYHLANKPRPDVGAVLGPAYGSNHGFEFDISIGRQQSATLVRAEGLNGSTAMNLQGIYGEDSASYENSGYNGMSPPPGNDSFWSPFMGGTASRGQTYSLSISYSLIDEYAGASPTHAETVAAVDHGTDWYAAAAIAISGPTSNAAFTVHEEEYPSPGDGKLGETGSWNTCTTNGCHWTGAKIDVRPAFVKQTAIAFTTSYEQVMNQTAVHEFGHAIGLAHDNLYDNGAGYSQFLSLMGSLPKTSVYSLPSHDIAKVQLLLPNCGSTGWCS